MLSRATFWSWGFLLPPLVLSLALFVGPLLYLFYVSIHESSSSELYGSRVTLSNYIDTATDPFYLLILERTLGTAAAILGLSLLIGYPVAYSVAHMPPSRRGLVLLLLLFPLMVSNVVRAYGWITILGRQGVVNHALTSLELVERPLELLYNSQAVVIGLLTILLPYMIISVANTLAGLDKAYEEAAQSLGASPFRTFIHVTFPLSSPGVASGLILVFLLTLSAYITITLLGGPRTKLFVSLVYDKVVGFQWPQAAALAFLLLAVALAGVLLLLALLKPGRAGSTR